MSKKPKLDEMQEKKLLKLEEAGFWMIFWLLFAAIIVQIVADGNFKAVIGEIIVLLIASVYIAFSSLKNGVWSKNQTPTLKSNVLTSLIPAILLGVFQAVRAFVILKKSVAVDLLLKIAAVMVVAYLVCLALLEVFRHIYKKQRDKLDNAGEADGE